MRLDGWAIESRLYAEDPYRSFLPSIGRLTRYRPPEERRSAGVAVRNDTGVFEGGEISMYYDPMIAKLCTWAPDRAAAIAAMRTALDALRARGDRAQPAVPVGGDGPSALRRGRDDHGLHRRGVSRRLPGGDAAGGDAAAGGGGGGGDAPGGGDPAGAGVRADGQPRAQGGRGLGGAAAGAGVPGADRRRQGGGDGRLRGRGERCGSPRTGRRGSRWRGSTSTASSWC